MNDGWNPWHGCHRYSEGCLNCYVYRMDARYERDSGCVSRTKAFDLPVKRTRDGNYKLTGGTVFTCFTSDFFLEDADEWRPQAWAMMKERQDLEFMFITKRILRAEACLPPDWGCGYPNVSIGCTMENQKRADERLPVFRDLPIKTKYVICEPLLEGIDFHGLLGPWAYSVVAGGESGMNARPCNYEWVLDLRAQAMAAGVKFCFRQTGARLIKDGRLYDIPRKQQGAQARKAGIDI